MGLILPSVRVPEGHRLAAIGMRLRLWSRPTLEDGRFTASMLLGLLWYAWAVVCVLASPDLAAAYAVVGLTDVVLRVWKVRSSVLFVPIAVWGLGLAALTIAKRLGAW